MRTVCLLAIFATALASQIYDNDNTSTTIADQLPKMEAEFGPLVSAADDAEAGDDEQVQATKVPLYANPIGAGLAYKILQVPDMHFTGLSLYPCTGKPADMVICVEAHMKKMLGRMLDDVKPDFVVFTGDQIEAMHFPHTKSASGTIRTYAAEVINRGLPWATVFGNHDENFDLPTLVANKDAQMSFIQTLPKSYSKAGPKGIGGVSNYQLAIQAPSNGFWGARDIDVLRFYFVDTGKDGVVTTQQHAYMEDLAHAHADQDVPALMFFHIPTPHYKNFTGVGQGAKGEAVSSGKDNAGLFDTMVAMGDVKASFVGHDHYNDYCFYEAPLHLCYGGGVGYGAAYGKADHARTARVIEWNVTAEHETIVTWLYRQGSNNANPAKYTIFERVLP
ncbi:Aste57867_2407 [Aphanomyces stellatus]|uniref:Aste57867_2407 protein n=1 Tax=Aphanomyces stellatus TaxID=120398 RepID=A0A485K8K0_9STRA|nr:hypothetical protein As57867_002401 [Aphanomyces stellatus]VFT79608.1 Aste57867_2407 [Aphanomyces stellatus]